MDVALLLVVRRELVQRPEMQVGQPLPLRQHPVFEVAGQ